MQIVQEIFEKNGVYNLKIDREKLNHSCEAWLHLRTSGASEYIENCTEPVSEKELVLIWQNSD